MVGDWLRVPHSPLQGECLSFHLLLHRALARSIRSLCAVVVPPPARLSRDWWKLPVFDTTTSSTASPATGHPLASILVSTLQHSNCRVVWSSTPPSPQHRATRTTFVSSAIAAAKVSHSLSDHPLRCIAAAQQIERHLWRRNGSSAAGMAMNYNS
eukprot:CAMPEP_0194423294 /NCGR_PEP_ID=MMETSP0176-20130528/22507_1 /TAXON_ID=216777 /ORGANISM="Proboscia alata, Strain PI-D3" /LENGTH=154 /DNA_ID=CAMNT_0039232405 /DNA_START=11 /DNA_END=471 /DNA_ORIENTATION=-